LGLAHQDKYFSVLDIGANEKKQVKFSTKQNFLYSCICKRLQKKKRQTNRGVGQTAHMTLHFIKQLLRWCILCIMMSN
jgi:predicted SprT family Zn-dependent metalloprotease